MPRIAVAQTPGAPVERWQETLALLSELIRRAGEQGAQIVVLPECVWPAYHIGTKQAYFAARKGGLPDHRYFLNELAARARQHRLMICAGYIEEDGERLFNTAGLISAAGDLLGTHRKCFLWDFDHDWFEPGQTIEPVQTAFGPVGMMICADARLPEIPATLVQRGARLIAQPTAWVNVGTAARLWNPQPDFMIRARAREFGVPIASASKWGSEGGTTFVGSSLICDGRGRVLVQCRPQETAVVTTEVELSAPQPQVTRAADRATLLAPKPQTLRVEVYPRGAALGSYSSAEGAGADAVPVLLVCPGASPDTLRGLDAIPARAALVLTEAVRIPVFLQSVCIAGVSDEDARGFAAIRALAIRNVHVVVVFGDDIDPTVIRTRAAENRVFVVVAGSAGAAIYDPGGQRSAACSWAGGTAAAPLVVTLDIGQAGDKLVAPGTDIVAGRDPAQYCF